MKPDFLFPHRGSRAQRMRLSEAFARMQQPPVYRFPYEALIAPLVFVFLLGWVAVQFCL